MFLSLFLLILSRTVAGGAVCFPENNNIMVIWPPVALFVLLSSLDPLTDKRKNTCNCCRYLKACWRCMFVCVLSVCVAGLADLFADLVAGGAVVAGGVVVVSMLLYVFCKINIDSFIICYDNL